MITYIFITQVNFAESLIAHVFMHGYTRHSSGLVYEYESGALNEAFSDIFSSMLDILNSQSKLTTIQVGDALNMQSPRQLEQSCSDVNWNLQNPEYVRINEPSSSSDPLGPGMQ